MQRWGRAELGAAVGGDVRGGRTGAFRARLVFTSNDAVGSSAIKTLGFIDSVMAIMMRWHIPNEN